MKNLLIQSTICLVGIFVQSSEVLSEIKADYFNAGMFHLTLIIVLSIIFGLHAGYEIRKAIKP